MATGRTRDSVLEILGQTGLRTPGVSCNGALVTDPVSGRDLRSARPSLDQHNRPAGSFTLSGDGARRIGRFGQFTAFEADAAVPGPDRCSRDMVETVERVTAGPGFKDLGR